jgi:hypothetical protein
LIPKGQLGAGKSHLKVTYRDIEVQDPHLVKITVKNTGPGDVASEHFDARKPLIIKLNCTMFGLTSTTHPTSTASSSIGAPAVICLGPQLLRRRETWVIEAIVGGQGEPELFSPLIDTDLVNEYARRIENENSVPIP